MQGPKIIVPTREEVIGTLIVLKIVKNLIYSGNILLHIPLSFIFIEIISIYSAICGFQFI